jgi:hypothetical protein
VSETLLEISELADRTRLAPATVMRRLRGVKPAAVQRRRGRNVRVWRLEDVDDLLRSHRLHIPGPTEVEEIRPGEERLRDAADRLGVSWRVLRRRLDRLGARWRYAKFGDGVVIAIPVGELGRVGLEDAPAPRSFEIAGIRIGADRATLHLAEVAYLIGEPVEDVQTLIDAGRIAAAPAPAEGHVEVGEMIRYLRERDDGIGSTLLLRLLRREIPVPRDENAPGREALLLGAVLGRPPGTR